MGDVNALISGAKRWFRDMRDRRFVLRHTRRLHGPRRMVLGDDEVLLVLLVRNGAWHMRAFLDHHLKLGVRHILVIDNGSDDATVDICRGYDRVTVLENRLPVSRFEVLLRSGLSRAFARGGWIMFADADELIEIPLPGPDGLAQLTDYMNTHGQTAALGQVLDQFSTLPYSVLSAMDYAQSVEAVSSYALDRLERIPYADADTLEFGWFLRDNECPDANVGLLRGGVRAELFGENPFLTRHLLVRNVPAVVPMSHPHCASGVRVADVTLLIRHLKLAGDWIGRDRRVVAEATWLHGENAQRLNAVAGRQGDFCLRAQQPLDWQGVRPLYDQGFLYASPRFRQQFGWNPAES